jgi:hypothetical protein
VWSPAWELTRSQPVATSGVAAQGVAASAGPGWWSGREAERAGDGCRGAQGPRRIASTMARSSGNALFANFSSYDAPFPAKVRLALANSWRKVRTRSDCCGNYGQPGC